MVKAIEIKNLKKTYQKGKANEVDALKCINLNINKGEFIAITGPSGCGKSTLLHSIGCLDGFDEGLYYLNGEDVHSLTNKQLAKIRNKTIGFVLQEHGLLADRLCWENVAIPLQISERNKKTIEGKSKAILMKFGLDEIMNKPPSQISVGQKQRVSIARALACDPDIILCDEPTGSLDSKNAMKIIETLKELNKLGKTIIIVTHNPNIAKECERVLILDEGRFVT
ncbi:MAG: ABC transporter ATP-binding protein [Clostridiales bacterium]|nr:ABC transporter ATP-binding protein [Clostridiales bacterium]